MTAVEHTRYEVTGWGSGELWTRGEVVLAHDFSFADVRAAPGSVDGGLPARFVAFLAGEPVSFDDIELDLTWATPFQRAVAQALRNVSRGEVVTYGELAAIAGYPRAARAVGTFCATNRFALLLPCHRVVSADGLGSYGAAGVEVKQRLLGLEGVLP